MVLSHIEMRLWNFWYTFGLIHEITGALKFYLYTVTWDNFDKLLFWNTQHKVPSHIKMTEKGVGLLDWLKGTSQMFSEMR